MNGGSVLPCTEYKFGAAAEVGGSATERHTVLWDRVPREKDYGTMRRAAAQVGEPAIRKVELSPEEGAIVSKYPPAAALAPERGDIRAVADLLKTKPEDSHLEKAYFEAVEFGEYWAEVYENLRRDGIAALENYYEDSDFGEVDNRLEALDAVLWALRCDIVRSRRDQRALELKYSQRITPGKTATFAQMHLF